METSKTVGRYLVATRDLEPMELVLSDQAAASGPLHEDTVVCLGCLKALSLPSADSAIAICQDCGLPFCSTTCQDDVIHKAQARQFERKGSPHLFDYTDERNICRILSGSCHFDRASNDKFTLEF